MILIYNVSIRLYSFAIHTASVFNKKARLWVQGRKNIFSKIEHELTKKNKSPIAWFHVASLGEFEQARPVIERFRSLYPTCAIVLTFFSPSGYEIRKNYSGADHIFYLPIDSTSNATRFLNLIRPSIVFFVKYEFWYHYLHEVKSRNIPLLLFSAIFRKDQPFFSRYTSFYKSILFCFTHIFVQTKNSALLLNSIGYKANTLAGDTRFDRVKQLYDSKKEFPQIDAFKNNSNVFIIGSAWNADMQFLLPFINSDAGKDLKFIIAPHEIDTGEIAGWQKSIHRKSIRYSELTTANAAENQILFIDNIGMLSSLYQYAEYAWIGGAFGKGLHNILEAATFGMPIFFGTNYKKFNEAIELIEKGAAISVSSYNVFYSSINKLQNNSHKRAQIAETARIYIQQNIGTTERIMDYIQINKLV